MLLLHPFLHFGGCHARHLQELTVERRCGVKAAGKRDLGDRELVFRQQHLCKHDELLGGIRFPRNTHADATLVKHLDQMQIQVMLALRDVSDSICFLI